MKKISTIIFALLCLVGSVNAQSLEQTFEQGNNLYAEGNFKAAAVQYQKVIDGGYSSSKLFYNAGNAYYKQKMYAKAILNYERAYKLGSSDGDINHNLQLARLQIRDNVDSVPTFFIVSWFNGIRNLFSANGWAWLSLLSFIFASALFICYYFTGTLLVKKITFGSSAFFVLLFAFSVWTAHAKTEQIKHPTNAIILSPVVVVRSSPDQNGKDLFIIHEGIKVTFTETPPVPGWREVKIADGNTGWVEANTFEII
ncbi:tetratricopeptide repeat protein [uncultured Acetobacteroides sp.]|uniref:tetratricopeptide repeat protein n=1 Tax=uncultured Acetobacteroides sp. TaxID=1760811 RepID=UPI0029F48CA2|nr:tetratricopeptide repeat protein [uncultured Acetobacteroides sp.]